MSRRKILQHTTEVGLVLLILTVLGLRLWVYEPVRVREISMLNTLHDGDLLLVNRLRTKHALPERGAIIVLQHPGSGEWVVKRVIGVGGDKLEIGRDGRVRRDGQPLDEPYAGIMRGERVKPFQVPADQVYVLGDNRAHSEDSRDYGPVPRDRIVGEVVRVLKRAKPAQMGV
jgi:signal peptidase I